MFLPPVHKCPLNLGHVSTPVHKSALNLGHVSAPRA